jgi:hypothetical protein
MVQNVHYVKMVFTQIVIKLASHAILHVKLVLIQPLNAHHAKIIHFPIVHLQTLARHAPLPVKLAILLQLVAHHAQMIHFTIIHLITLARHVPNHVPHVIPLYHIVLPVYKIMDNHLMVNVHALFLVVQAVILLMVQIVQLA